MAKQKKLYGLGGWMIIPMINLFVVGIIAIWGIAVIPLTSIIMIGLSAYALYLAFNYDKTFPKIFIIWLWVGLGLNSITLIPTGEYSTLFGNLIFNVIWHSYMNKSVRVKNTFKE